MTTSAERARGWRSQLYAARERLRAIDDRRLEILKESYERREPKDYMRERYVFGFFEAQQDCFTFPQIIDEHEPFHNSETKRPVWCAMWGKGYHPSLIEIATFDHAAVLAKKEPAHFSGYGQCHTYDYVAENFFGRTPRG